MIIFFHLCVEVRVMEEEEGEERNEEEGDASVSSLPDSLWNMMTRLGQ